MVNDYIHLMNLALHAEDRKSSATKLDFLFSGEDQEQRRKLKVDHVALYSVTNSVDASEMAKILKSLSDDDINAVTDLTACVGGNTIAFCREFGKVFAIEINARRYRLLLHNLSTLGFTNAVCWNGSASHFLTKNNIDIRTYFIDPPWGGPSMSSRTQPIFFCGSEIYDWCHSNFSRSIHKIVVGLKLPPNYPIPQATEHVTVKVFENFRKMKLVVLIYHAPSFCKTTNITITIS